MNIWEKLKKESNKSSYDISRELGIEEQKVKEIINGEREVATQDMDRVVKAFQTKPEKVAPIERTLMEEFFKENKLNDLKKKFGYKKVIELANDIGVANSTLYRVNSEKDIKLLSNRNIKKIYDFFQNNFNKKVTVEKHIKNKNKISNTKYPQVDYEELPEEVREWFENTDINQLLVKKGMTKKQLLKKIGFTYGYYAILCDAICHRENKRCQNAYIIQKLYDYFNKGKNYQKPVEKTDYPEMPEETTMELREPTGENMVIHCNTIPSTIAPLSFDFVTIPKKEYEQTMQELERYKFLIDLAMKK